MTYFHQFPIYESMIYFLQIISCFLLRRISKCFCETVLDSNIFSLNRKILSCFKRKQENIFEKNRRFVDSEFVKTCYSILLFLWQIHSVLRSVFRNFDMTDENSPVKFLVALTFNFPWEGWQAGVWIGVHFLWMYILASQLFQCTPSKLPLQTAGRS